MYTSRHRTLSSYHEFVSLVLIFQINTQNAVSNKKSMKYDGSDYMFLDAHMIPPFLHCGKCHNLSVSPTRMQCQTTPLPVYCKSCASHSKGCERSNCEGFSDDEINKQIKELVIMCPNFAAGCEWTGQLGKVKDHQSICCLLYTSPSPRDATLSRMPSSA